jgi:hypothetical protein
MEIAVQKPAARRPPRVRLDLSTDVAEALERRARRNDRYPYLEAARIIREALLRDGDLAAEQSEDDAR